LDFRIRRKTMVSLLLRKSLRYASTFQRWTMGNRINRQRKQFNN